eukprot:1494194-Heterocapsa_arctica.AAC.1
MTYLEAKALSVNVMDELHVDMKNENDEFKHKPWRVNTTVARLLRPLSLCCDETHEHGVAH